jgi:signal transduction histidine kinase
MPDAARIDVRELPPAWGDPAAIEQIFGNLIENAVRHLDPQRAGCIEIGALETSAERGGAGAPARVAGPRTRTYYVRDNGVGIPEAWQPKLFHAFQRLHGGDSGGEGIGLALARRIAERHGGQMWVESAEGMGSTFFVALPDQPLRAA